MKVLLLVVIQLITLIGYLTAQPDSLLIKFRKIPKTADNIPRLIELSYNLIDYNVDSALICADQIRQISLPKNDYELQCKILVNLGIITKLKGKYEESNGYLFQALEIAEKNNLISCKITCLYQIGDLNRCIGLLDQSIYYLYVSKNLAHKNNVNQEYPELYEHISSTFYQLTEHTHPKFKLTKIPFQNEFDLEKSSPDVYFSLCKLYADSALIIAELKNDNRTKLSCLNVIGAYYRQNNNDIQAIEYFNKAIDLAEKINNKIDIPNYYINTARTWFDEKQYEKAIEVGLKAYQMAVELNILIYKSTAANILRLSYIEMKDYKNALEYQHIEASTRAEMLSQENWNKISELDKKYQTQENQKEIVYQKIMIDLKNTEVFRRNIVIVCLLIACLIIVFGIFYIQNQKTVLFRQKEEIEVQSEKIMEQYKRLEKLDHFKESLTHALVHDLKNPLSQIMHGAGNQAVNHPARKMLRLITNMLDVEKYENTEFRLNKELHSLRNILEEVKSGQEVSLKEKNLQLNFLFDGFLVLADKEVIVRVFDNLLTNAIRFSPKNRTIDVQAEKSGDNEVTIGIKNYGEPIPLEAIPFVFDKYRQFGKTENGTYHSTGLGLTFCKMAIEAHGQKISTRNLEDGVLFTFTLNGNLNPEQMQSGTKDNPKTGLTHDEKVLLEPFFDRLKTIGVHEVSDILLVLNEIPAGSENIDALKQQIIDAAFATNAELYRLIIYGE
ncbi:MAG: ATP-binding protein [Mariniphaga sp.]